ncbi:MULTISPECIES: LacI family DNA-binding transcriptional regulator [unclassified Clostridium]|uniref:LacI family DNA-binding transcriptional regulator n=1 Tax=unclassified Clostridium TaxID=2614128 RepID=UPI000E470A4C|nr:MULTISPECIES: LacI family DNA-binding transcriptional regulator [unclassified Clostridium]RHP44922.1 LacI family transcriptional regulator [Clostridium sp. AF32-12BH]RHS88923.1 LacI family transcriptional regulator [Clostridium sp. AM42-4]RHV88746.1 LacI family transcriptional regulator [Clostridium sp. OF09-36]HBM47695.1 LacI family transcriptional regulator [Lachnoclostridium sp.]
MNIKELARRAGVSSATVSRVLNNSGYVKEETRKKVLEAVEEYNYVPNALARNLSIKDNPSIGVIIPDIENEFFFKAISGISDVADAFHYNIVYFGTNETLSKEHESLNVAISQRLKGVIIAPISQLDTQTKDSLIKLEESGIPVVLIDRDIKGARFDGVFVDNYGGAYDGVSALIQNGHKKIAVIAGPSTSKPGKERLAGYKQALEDAGIPVREDYIAYGDFKREKAYESAKSLLKQPDPPTAIFSSNNESTLGCLKCLTECGMVPGREIALLGFDDIETLRVIDYKLSVVERDAKQQGAEAMKLLMECFADSKNRQRGKRILVPYQVVLRGSERGVHMEK